MHNNKVGSILRSIPPITTTTTTTSTAIACTFQEKLNLANDDDDEEEARLVHKNLFTTPTTTPTPTFPGTICTTPRTTRTRTTPPLSPLVVVASASAGAGASASAGASAGASASASPPPSASCFQRKMSTAVATAPDAEHELLEGRPRVVYSGNGSNNGSGNSNSSSSSSSSPSPATTTATTTTSTSSSTSTSTSNNQTPPTNKNNNNNSSDNSNSNTNTNTPGKKLSNLFARVSSSVTSSSSLSSRFSPSPLPPSAAVSPAPSDITTTTTKPSPQSSSSHHHHPAVIKRSVTVPIDARLPDYLLHPPPLRMEHWSDTPASAFSVRGPTYGRDRIKQPSDDAVFTLLTVDVVQVDRAPLQQGLCLHPTERIQRALQRERDAMAAGQPIPPKDSLPAFVFCVNYIVPGGTVSSSSTGDSNNNNNSTDTFFHWAAYFGTDHVAALRDTTTPLGRLTEPFFFGDLNDPDTNAFRNQSFKLIPRIVQGNFMVRKAVGSKPALLGRKLQLSYRRDETSTCHALPRFFEVMVDIGSDPVADRIVKLALGGAKSLVVDMMFLLEGTDETKLPERILGGARMEYLDFKNPVLSRKIQHPPNPMTNTTNSTTNTTMRTSDEPQQEQ